MLSEYLERREADLFKFHPQWDFTNKEIENSNDLLKRDLTPICIPPSWDLVQKYAGALDKNADGFHKDFYEKGKSLYIGDQGEADFLDIMRNLTIGGILIGDVSYLNLLHGHKISETNKEYYHLPGDFIENLKKQGTPFQFDFLYFHPIMGLIHIEVKNRRCFDLKNLRKVGRQKQRLKELFQKFCETLNYDQTESIWKRNFYGSILYQNRPTEIQETKHRNDYCKVITTSGELKHYFKHFVNYGCNVLKEQVFRKFLVFLAGYRPDFFISPVKCALRTHENIFAHQINTLNFYNNIKNASETGTQNSAIPVKVFLEGMKFLKHVDINFGAYKSIYLTKEQVECVGRFEVDGYVSPLKQAIFGPPGSGKSLILMLKLFIFGQMEERRDRRIICVAGRHGDNTQYARKLKGFIDDNNLFFCREVSLHYCGQKLPNDYIYDLLYDEAGGGIFETLNKRSGPEDPKKIVTVIITGYLGDITNSDKMIFYALKRVASVVQAYEIVELKCIFRSSRQIQSCFQSYRHLRDRDIIYASGHNFDGVKIERYFIEIPSKLENAVLRRIQKLTQVEHCDRTMIGVYWSGRIKRHVANSLQGIYFNNDRPQYMSSEFPIMILVNTDMASAYLLFSRAMCHLIVFTTCKTLPESESVLRSQNGLTRWQ